MCASCDSVGAKIRRAGSTPARFASARRLRCMRGWPASSHSTRVAAGGERGKPGGKQRPSQLVSLVEAGEHQRALGQAVRRARCRGGEAAPAVVDVIAARQAPDPLVEIGLVGGRDHFRVGDDAVDRVVAERPREAHVMHLHRRRPRGQDGEPPALGVAVAVDQDVDAVVANQARGLGVAECTEVAPMRRTRRGCVRRARSRRIRSCSRRVRSRRDRAARTGRPSGARWDDRGSCRRDSRCAGARRAAAAGDGARPAAASPPPSGGPRRAAVAAWWASRARSRATSAGRCAGRPEWR